VRACARVRRLDGVRGRGRREGLVEAGARKPDLVILDLGLPDMDGIDFIRDLRGWSATPILHPVGALHEPTRSAALDAGADDYLTKPFALPELIARVRALRRRQALGGGGQSARRFRRRRGDSRATPSCAGQSPFILTPIEYRCSPSSSPTPARFSPIDHLLREVGGRAMWKGNHYLRIYVGHLRQSS